MSNSCNKILPFVDAPKPIILLPFEISRSRYPRTVLDKFLIAKSNLIKVLGFSKSKVD